MSEKPLSCPDDWDADYCALWKDYQLASERAGNYAKRLKERNATIAEMRESLTECVQLLYNSGHVIAARKITTLLKANS